MNLTKLTAKEIRAFDAAKIAETSKALRKELVGLRMDVYKAGPQASAAARSVRKVLARVLTVGTEKTQAAKK